MQPFEIAALCRAIVYGIALAALLIEGRSRHSRVDRLAVLALAALTMSASLTVAGVSRDLLGALASPVAGLTVMFVLLRRTHPFR